MSDEYFDFDMAVYERRDGTQLGERMAVTNKSGFFVKEMIAGREVIHYDRNAKRRRTVTFPNLKKATQFCTRLNAAKYKGKYTADVSERTGDQTNVDIVYNKQYVVDPNQTPYDIKGKKLRMAFGDHPLPQVFFEEIDTTRKDNFEMPEYKNYNTYIQNFVAAKDFYKENDLFYRLGILMYGPPGNGKTSYFRYMLANNILPEDTTVIWTDYVPTSGMVKALKEISSLKVFIFEELTSAVSTPNELRKFLQFMDGEDTIENSIYFATTNHPEALPYNVIDRPGRFDQLIEVPNPDYDSREKILKTYFKNEFEEYMVNAADNLSIADIKEAFLLSKIHKMTFRGAIDKLKNHKEYVKSSFTKYKKIGFGD